MEENTEILVQVDKTVVKVTGLSVKGLNIQQLEEILLDRMKSLIRIIGVTGTSLEMDVYGMEEQDILRDSQGLISAIAAAEGIQLSDVAKLASVEKIRSVDIDRIPPYREGGCGGERWRQL